MSRVLTTTVAIIIMLGIAAVGTAQAWGANLDRDSRPWVHPTNPVLVSHHVGYAGPVYDAHPARDKCGSRLVAVCAPHMALKS
jgi:hypothetical protein